MNKVSNALVMHFLLLFSDLDSVISLTSDLSYGWSVVPTLRCFQSVITPSGHSGYRFWPLSPSPEAMKSCVVVISWHIGCDIVNEASDTLVYKEARNLSTLPCLRLNPRSYLQCSILSIMFDSEMNICYTIEKNADKVHLFYPFTIFILI